MHIESALRIYLKALLRPWFYGKIKVLLRAAYEKKIPEIF